MALEKALPSTFGVDALYWKIVNLEFDVMHKRGRIVMAGFTSEEARHNGKSSVLTRVIEVPPDMMDEYLSESLDALISDGYSLAKNYNFIVESNGLAVNTEKTFKEAQDV